MDDFSNSRWPSDSFGFVNSIHLTATCFSRRTFAVGTVVRTAEQQDFNQKHGDFCGTNFPLFRIKPQFLKTNKKKKKQQRYKSETSLCECCGVKKSLAFWLLAAKHPLSGLSCRFSVRLLTPWLIKALAAQWPGGRGQKGKGDKSSLCVARPFPA